RRGIGAQRHGHGERHARRGTRMIAKIERAAAMREPAHDHLVARDHLLPVDAEILSRLVRTARDGQSPRDERTGIAAPAGLHGEASEVYAGALPDDLLARRGTPLLRRHV